MTPYSFPRSGASNEPRTVHARKGLTVAPADERLYRILLQAAATDGNRHLIDAITRELRQAVEEWIEPHGTLQPETLTLLEQLRPRQRRSA